MRLKNVERSCRTVLNVSRKTLELLIFPANIKYSSKYTIQVANVANKTSKLPQLEKLPDIMSM